MLYNRFLSIVMLLIFLCYTFFVFGADKSDKLNKLDKVAPLNNVSVHGRYYDVINSHVEKFCKRDIFQFGKPTFQYVTQISELAGYELYSVANCLNFNFIATNGEYILYDFYGLKQDDYLYSVFDKYLGVEHFSSRPIVIYGENNNDTRSGIGRDDVDFMHGMINRYVNDYVVIEPIDYIINEHSVYNISLTENSSNSNFTLYRVSMSLFSQSLPMISYVYYGNKYIFSTVYSIKNNDFIEDRVGFNFGSYNYGHLGLPTLYSTYKPENDTNSSKKTNNSNLSNTSDTERYWISTDNHIEIFCSFIVPACQDFASEYLDQIMKLNNVTIYTVLDDGFFTEESLQIYNRIYLNSDQQSRPMVYKTLFYYAKTQPKYIDYVVRDFANLFNKSEVEYSQALNNNSYNSSLEFMRQEKILNKVSVYPTIIINNKRIEGLNRKLINDALSSIK